MDFYTEHEFSQASNWYCNTQPFLEDTNKITDFSPFEGFPEFAWESEVSYQSNHIYINEFKDLENFNFDFNLPLLHENFDVNNQNPLNVVFPALEHCNEKAESVGECSFAESSGKIGNGFSRFVKEEEEYVYQEQSPLPLSLPLSCSSTSFVRSKKSCLQYDEIKEHFDVPITLAAKRLNVGLTVLKKRCRELNITRWPHRKLKSLMLLIENLKEMGLDNEVARLEKQKKLFETIPGMELTEETKKLRQACFKNCYKERRLLKFHR